MMHGRPRYVRVSTAEFDLAPGVSLEAWGLLLWIGRFRAERWPACVVRVADLGATGASIRRLRRLLMELWNAGLVTLVDDDLRHSEALLGDDDDAAARAFEELENRVSTLEIGKQWRIICEMLAEDSPNLDQAARARLLNRERQRRHRFRQKLKAQVAQQPLFRIDHNGVTSRPLRLDHDPPPTPSSPGESAAPTGARVFEVASGARGARTPAVEQNRPVESLGGGGSHYPPGESANAPPRGNDDGSEFAKIAGAVVDMLRQN